jgi:5-oxoprolinase (ATP-hydrolysing) subunit A
VKWIDFNSDMGELPELLADGTQERIMDVVSSVNVACGAHAGDAATIAGTIAAAKRRGLAVGAHPGYPDRVNFGRKVMELTGEQLSDEIFRQLRYLAGLAEGAGVQLVHVKPHGALYHEISSKEAMAEAFCQGVARFSRDVAIVGLAGSRGLDVAAVRGFRVAAEAFMDRTYEADGSLRARAAAGALIIEPARALAQALEIAERGRVLTPGGETITLKADTLCVHSDTPGSAILARAVAEGLHAAGIGLRSLDKNTLINRSNDSHA